MSGLAWVDASEPRAFPFDMCHPALFSKPRPLCLCALLDAFSWYGEFNGGVELSGCAGGGRPFAKDAATAPGALAGGWRTEAAESYTYVASAGGQMELVSGQQPGAGASGCVHAGFGGTH